jgi:hypothetical protein
MTEDVSDVRFVVVDSLGCVDSTSITNPVTGSLTSGSSTSLTVYYKTTLNNDLVGRRRANAAVVMLYAVYSNGSTDVSIPMKITIQDCQCCGAWVAENTWKTFMCHNLEAGESADPFTPSYKLNGAYYQWGCKNKAKSEPNEDGSDATTIAWSTYIPAKPLPV